ncbi:tellurite resistance/C4-dicarboxylate transporter family protein [[Mycobacterium] crassicus]|uniref:Tellurite resistance/C4-dicarboxylate transporter family protein n=1 Tax=[Mycobacterium] crassicus TaxID=2872309 RepID=A0ABU5XAW0_9MYCO|nr:tellurite resistance/C4-dicarboxylate transporter family protein [Mycolicibacter sp. MYC098]MEB3019450.1 tellurite resistance/C4-dicarboxylate transporter family protein [Mycolicibacter sp. MYC098]
MIRRPAPDVFAVVMATGILSIAAQNHHYRWLSEALGVIATATMAVLMVVAAGSISRWDLRDPDVTLRLFTFVAACAVLDSRLFAHPVVVRALGVVALSAWLVLTVLTCRSMASRGLASLHTAARGSWELAGVGTSGLAIVVAQVARHTGDRGWAVVALAIWLLAMAVYLVMTWLILWRTADERKDREGFEPDDWILMGALAIATLAGHSIYGVTADWLAGPVRAVTVVTWALASGWIPPLVYFMLHRVNRRPAVLQFTGAWWALVFPLGMYAVATAAMATELHTPALTTVSLVFFWNALTAWVIVAVAGLLRARAVSWPVLRRRGGTERSVWPKPRSREHRGR